MIGKRYIEHSDMCGCERCARQWDRENPGRVFDVIEDPNVCSYCGDEGGGFCRCWDERCDDGED